MGIIKAAVKSVTGSIQDQFLEVIEPAQMEETTLFTSGVPVRRNGARGTAGTISNGSVIHVYQNQLMLLVDGGQVVDYSAEEGYYTVENSSLPSAFNGELGEAVTEAFSRFKFGGITPTAQRVYYINLQEVKGIKFGTRAPINYFDTMYNAELFLRVHGSYSIKITNPLLFYKEVVPQGASQLDVQDMGQQLLNEFLEALTATINQMSVDGVRISHVASKGRELSKYMANILDEDWRQSRGMEIQSVGIAGISYDDESQRLINMRNQGAMMSDPAVREGYLQSAVARGIEAAGSNSAGAAQGFMGVNMAMNAAGGASAFSAHNADQLQKADADKGWPCVCGHKNEDDARFCAQCGKPRPTSWVCSCGATSTGAFCSQCGKARPASAACPSCGKPVTEGAAFCPHCGKKL